MKIVHIVLSAGADYTDNWSYQENTLPVLQMELGNDVSLITSTTSSLVKDLRSTNPGKYYVNGVKIIRISPTLKLIENKIAWFNSLANVLESEKPNLIFVHGIGFLSLSQIQKYKDHHPEVVVVFDSHVTYENSMNRFKTLNKYLIHKGLWKHIYQKHKSIFSKGYYIAPQVKTFLVEMYDVDPNCIDHLPLGTNVPEKWFDDKTKIRDSWRKKHNIIDKSIVLITGGRFRESKKLYELIKAFKMIDIPNIVLCIFGRFEDSEYERIVLDLINEDERIKMLGWLDQERMLEAYLSSDLGVFSGSQSVIWRTAIACGLPLICNYSDGAEEMDFNGNLFFVHDDDVYEWNQAITNIISSSEKLSNMKEITINLAKPFFTEKRIAQVIIDDYYTIVNSRKDKE